MLGIIPHPCRVRHKSGFGVMMSEENQPAEAVDKDSGDGLADAIAVTAILAIVIATVVYWLNGFSS